MNMGIRQIATVAVTLAAVMVMLSEDAAGYGTQRERGGPRADWKPEAMDVEVADRIGHTVPLDVTLRNEAGREVTLDQLLEGDRPVVLNLGYFQCPSLCTEMLNRLLDTVRHLAWTPGNEYEILTVSFDAREGPELARTKKHAYINELGRPEAASGWHFLTGDEGDLDRLREAVGFEIKWDSRLEEWAHPGVLIILTPEGEVSRYLGLQHDAETLRMSLVEASRGEKGSFVDQIFLTCFAWDPDRGRYTMEAVGLMMIGGVLTVLVLASLIGTALWREFRRRKRGDQNAPVNAGSPHPGTPGTAGSPSQ